MKTIDKILFAINEECERQTTLAEVSCFDKIAGYAGVTRQRLHLYLNELQEQAYIRYSVHDEYVYITREGKQHLIQAGESQSLA